MAVKERFIPPPPIAPEHQILRPRIQLKLESIVEQFEKLEASRQAIQNAPTEAVAAEALDEQSRTLRELRLHADELNKWFESLTEKEKDEFSELWSLPHVRHAAKEISDDPRVYRRYIKNKDVARYIEMTGIKPWESMPTLDIEYPSSPEQTVPSIWQIATGRLRKELELGGPKAAYPHKFHKLRNQFDWGTYDDPILVPTTQGERMIECEGKCVPFTKGESHIWAMRPGETCICERCLQYFHCFDSRVYDPEEYPPEELEHELAEEEDKLIEPRTSPLQVAKEWEAKRRMEDVREIQAVILAEQHGKAIRTASKELIVAILKREDPKRIEELRLRLETLRSSPPTPEENPVDISEASGFWVNRAKKRAARREAEDKYSMQLFMESLAKEQRDLEKPPTKPPRIRY